MTTSDQEEDNDQTNNVERTKVDFDSILPHVGEMGWYQLKLYLLLCIPACLPAAFLAFNQVFLSAEPDHWCKVSELEEFPEGNLTAQQIRALSIPRRYLNEERKDVFMYEKCFQYDVNFTQIYETHGRRWPKLGDDSWNRTYCKEGWNYDRSEYKDTLVTEVSHLFNGMTSVPV